MSVATFCRRTAWVVLVLIAVGGLVGYSTAAATSDAPQLTSAGSAMQFGAQMEHARRWGDAIEHYQKSLKLWPDNQDLQYGLRRSKIQFNIDRRYSDSSFEVALLRLPLQESLNLFDEVLYQVRAYYVSPISPWSYVAHGTESLYMATKNEKFVQRHMRNVDSKRIEQFQGLLRNSYWNKQINGPAEARQTVEEVAHAAAQMTGISETAVALEYTFGGCNALDDYSGCLTSDRLDDIWGNIEGEFVGLGIEMKAELGKGQLIVNVLPSSPAAEGGILRGDHIVRIDSHDCVNMTTDEAAKLLRGLPGSQVRLVLEDPVGNKRRGGTFSRRAVQVDSIPVARIVDAEAGVAYIQMTGFQKTTAAELDAALNRLHREGMRSLIWDVRRNPGGLLNSAADVLDRFIGDGVLVSVRGRSEGENSTYTAYRQGTWQMPLVLLVDGDSASASEIVAGAIQDHKRGTVVGRTTYGKWSVQRIIRVRDQAGLRLTTSKFYSPTGRNLGGVGLNPDVAVDLPDVTTTYYRGAPDGSDIEHDPDVQKAVSILKRQYAHR